MACRGCGELLEVVLLDGEVVGATTWVGKTRQVLSADMALIALEAHYERLYPDPEVLSLMKQAARAAHAKRLEEIGC